MGNGCSIENNSEWRHIMQRIVSNHFGALILLRKLLPDSPSNLEAWTLPGWVAAEDADAQIAVDLVNEACEEKVCFLRGGWIS